MDDIFLSTPIDKNRKICISPLSAKVYREAGGQGLGGDYGYFIYEIDLANPQAGIEVIAKAVSIGAAMRLYELLIESRRPENGYESPHQGFWNKLRQFLVRRSTRRNLLSPVWQVPHRPF